MDRQDHIENDDFDDRFVRSPLAWFSVSSPVECRFIRLTQTTRESRKIGLTIAAFDFFGTLLQ
jgi:hypothetical protein